MARSATVTAWDDRKLIDDYLACHNTMTLATSSSDGPWAAAVFYAHDKDLVLYFKSDPETRHMQDTRGLPGVAATIHDDGQDWKSIRGLQIVGSCSRIDEHDLSRIDRCYIKKFPFLATVAEHAGDADERVLADRLKNTPFFQLRPDWIRLIDNARGFGYKTEIWMKT
jgi:uncharacterized protein YhbP (UPF0306 family)